MYEESVITPVAERNAVFYIVPRAIEDKFVDLDCDTSPYEYARLDLMLEIVNQYKTMPEQDSEYKTGHYHFSREGLKEGMLAAVRPV